MRLLWLALRLFLAVLLIFHYPSNTARHYSYDNRKLTDATYCPQASTGREDCTPEQAPPAPKG
ncbi:hypothetical protein TorRG33x02_339280, partial [Trema orientale]